MIGISHIFLTAMIVTGICVYLIGSPERRILTYTRVNSDGTRLLKLPNAFNVVFMKDKRFKHTRDVNAANIVFFERLTDIHVLYKTIDDDSKLYYSLACIDHISSKSRLYEMLNKRLGSQVSHLVPATLAINSRTTVEDIEKFAQSSGTNKLIFKSNVQQQRGLNISSVEDSNTVNLREFVVVQELLFDAYLIAGHKINLRQYVIGTCDKYSKLHFFAYTDGFVYYASDKFEEDTFDAHVTSGHIDRKIYEANPLTIKDFERSLDKDCITFMNNKKGCLRTMFAAITPDLEEIEKKVPVAKFTILGVDLHVTSELKILVMEINKGCDLSFKDSRDGRLKEKMIRDTLSLVVDGDTTNFTVLC